MFSKSRILYILLFTLTSLTCNSTSFPTPGETPPPPPPLSDSFNSILSLLKSNTALLDTPLLTLKAIKNYIETLLTANAPSVQSLLPFLNSLLTQIKIFDNLNDVTDRIEMSKLILNEFQQTINSTVSSIKDSDEWSTLINILSKALNSYEQEFKEEMLINILNDFNRNNTKDDNDVQTNRTKHEQHPKEGEVFMVDGNLIVIGVLNVAAVAVVLFVCYFLRKRRVHSGNVEVQREVKVEQRTYAMKRNDNYNKLEMDSELGDGKEEGNKDGEENDSNDNKVKIKVKVVK